MVKEKLRAFVAAFKREIAVYRLVLADPRTPRLAKLILAAAVAYALSPIDLIPDFIPLLGYLDDILVLPLLVWLALKLIPSAVIADARHSVDTHRDNSGLDKKQGKY